MLFFSKTPQQHIRMIILCCGIDSFASLMTPTKIHYRFFNFPFSSDEEKNQQLLRNYDVRNLTLNNDGFRSDQILLFHDAANSQRVS